LFLWGVLSGRLERADLTAPIIFVAVGGLFAAAGLVAAPSLAQTLKPLVELTLVWVLFSDAAGVAFGQMREDSGLAFGAAAGRRAPAELGFLEQAGSLVSMLVWFAFGALAIPIVLVRADLVVVAYAILRLTLVRMVPVWLAMLGTGARPPTVAFLGWFGPRGLASIVFAVIVVQEADLPHASTILLTTYATVGLSVLLHGLTAAPLASRYAAWFASHPADAMPAMESVPAGEHHWRRTIVLDE